MIIRQETKADFDPIYQLIAEAFHTAEYSNGTEQDLVVSLRTSKAFEPKLSLVAEIDHMLVGHILFSRAQVSNTTILALAPLSVVPQFQGGVWVQHL